MRDRGSPIRGDEVGGRAPAVIDPAAIDAAVFELEDVSIGSATDLVRSLRSAGVRTAVVSSSDNAASLLTAAGIDGLFEVRVDGIDAECLSLTGKPKTEMHLEALVRLSVPARRAVLIDDSVDGVRAGRASGFGLVVAIDRDEGEAELRSAGADAVVRDLAQVRVAATGACCSAAGDGGSPWVLAFEGFVAADELRREVLCATGNGYLATRAAAPEASAGGAHYPGTYLAGVYNRLVSKVHGRDLEHEDLVNTPNWLTFSFRAEGGDWFGESGWRGEGRWAIVRHRQELDIRHGILTRQVQARDREGRLTTVTQRRLVSMHAPHLAALQVTLVAENWSGPVEILAGIDGEVTNSGVGEYRQLTSRHLTVERAGAVSESSVVVEALTVQSRIRIAIAARTGARQCRADRPVRTVASSKGRIDQQLRVELEPHRPVVVEKVVATYTSRDVAISDCALAAADAVARADDFAGLAAAHRVAWERLWARSALWVDVGGRTPLIVNLHLFHLLQSLSPHTAEVDAGVTARGLHGEAYRGHVFWDELFVFPLLNFRFPELSRSLLRYRCRRLDEARRLAAEAGHRGAMFPWQSGTTGREETPTQLFNARSGRWMPDNSRLQRHVGLAIAYNVWHYYQVTGDLDFLRDHGAELLFEIARFFASLAVYDPNRDRYDISGVMGPDEFHDGYPETPGSGLVNNTYTNVMAAWTLWRAGQIADLLVGQHAGELFDRLDLRPEELAHWQEVSRKITVLFDSAGRLTQFDGYGDLAELDWAAYRARYRNIGRLDLILESEGDTTNRYKVAKQADVLMLFYMLTAEELEAVLARLGYRFDPATIPATVRYYLARTSAGSTLCRVVHAWVLARSNREGSWQLFLDALSSDIDDIQGGTTAEGIHLGAMAGTIDLLQRCYTELDVREDTLHFNPRLPEGLPRLRFEVTYRRQQIELDVTHRTMSLRARPSDAPPVRVAVRGEPFELAGGESRTVRLGPE